MKVNLHKYDRGVRIILGAGLVSMAFVGPQNLWFLLGLIPFLTGSVGYCPLYQVFGFSTCPLKGK